MINTNNLYCRRTKSSVKRYHMSGKESEQERIISILRSYPKGLTIDEVSRLLSISRATAGKYLNSMIGSGQAELRELGRAKLFYISQRLPLTNLLSLASDLILILDNELFIRETNEAFLEALHLDREDLKGLKLEHSKAAPFFSEEHYQALKNALRGEAASFEISMGEDQDARFYKMKVIPLIFEEGSAGAAILLEDITSMKKYQQELEERVRLRTAALVKTNDALQKEIEEHKRTEEALSSNEARLKRAEGVAKFGSWEYYPENQRLILSDGAQALFGLTGRELPLSQMMAIVREEDRPLIIRADQELISDNKPYNIEYFISRRGEESAVAIHTIAEYDREKNIIFGVSHDVSDKKRAEDAIRRATRQIVLLNSVTRHDILNQLNTLAITLGVMKKQNPDPAMQNLLQTEETIADTIRRQIIFTRDYQNIGLEPPRWTAVDPMIRKALITTDMGGVQLGITTGNLELFTDLLIEKVYFNLVDNSLRHGIGVTTMTFSFEETGNGLNLVYEDDGQGIPDEEKERIFERGYGKNTGYGLFLVREILSITGFSIRECGIPGNGARFEIAIPRGSFRFGSP